MSRNGAVPPATTRLSGCTAFTPAAIAFTIARYRPGETGPAADELRPQHDADVGLVPRLPEANARQSLDLSAIAPRGRVRELPELHGIGPERHVVDLGVSGIGPLRRAVDRHERLQPSLGDRRDLAVEVFPVVGGVVRVASVEVRAVSCGTRRRNVAPVEEEPERAGARRTHAPQRQTVVVQEWLCGQERSLERSSPVRVAGEDAGTGSENEEREQPREDGRAAAHVQLLVVT